MPFSCFSPGAATGPGGSLVIRGSSLYLSLIARQQRWQRRWLCGLTLLTLLLFLFSLVWGEFVLLPWQSLGDLEQRILLELRLPRALLALLAGAALACGGAVLQVMLHNPVAEPGLLGVSSGAGLAAMVAMAVAKSLLSLIHI